MNLDPVLLLIFAPMVFFIIGAHFGKMAEHERQRRLGKVRSRLGSLDPADVRDSMLDTIEAALPEPKKS
jgi:hypothetical protein